MKKEDSLNGKWIGQLTYDRSYPAEYRNKILKFEIGLTEENGVINGSCEDNLTRDLHLQPATIIGTYQSREINFIKRYPCRITLKENNVLIAQHHEPPIEIYYTGTLHQRLFSKKDFFKGTWNITQSFADERGNVRFYKIGGKWTMARFEE